MRRTAFATGLVLAATSAPATAQSWAPWAQPSLSYERPQARATAAARPTARRGRPERHDAPVARASGDGGPRPHIAAASPAAVRVSTGHGPGTVVIDTSARRLYLMQSRSTALVYPISVGRDGFRWTGTKTISRVASWPTWTPPAEMHARQPGLPQTMTGGVRNPLGARALYLGSSLYRIHGTNSASSVGHANSSGCFRMSNSHVVDLASRVGVGTRVVVKSRL